MKENVRMSIKVSEVRTDTGPRWPCQGRGPAVKQVVGGPGRVTRRTASSGTSRRPEKRGARANPTREPAQSGGNFQSVSFTDVGGEAPGWRSANSGDKPRWRTPRILLLYHP